MLFKDILNALYKRNKKQHVKINDNDWQGKPFLLTITIRTFYQDEGN